ncbi:MAG: hypothetical protein K9N62_14255 [Verrucomicrobia bacterium]|nr:hypothetical protein [Verrucomicrobiota bacterium]
MDFLVLSDAEGRVDITLEALARRINVPIEIVKAAIAELEGPDPKSRTETDDGRRIERLYDHIDWGWRVINKEDYRDMKCLNDVKERSRKRSKAFRDKKAAEKSTAESQDPVQPVESKAKTTETNPKAEKPIDFPQKFSADEDFMKSWASWEVCRRAMKKPARSWNEFFQHQVDWLEKMPAPDAIESLNQSLRNGYQGLFEPRTPNRKGNSNGYKHTVNRNAGTYNDGPNLASYESLVVCGDRSKNVR